MYEKFFHFYHAYRFWISCKDLKFSVIILIGALSYLIFAVSDWIGALSCLLPCSRFYLVLPRLKAVMIVAWSYLVLLSFSFRIPAWCRSAAQHSGGALSLARRVADGPLGARAAGVAAVDARPVEDGRRRRGADLGVGVAAAAGAPLPPQSTRRPRTHRRQALDAAHLPVLHGNTLEADPTRSNHIPPDPPE